MTNEEWEDVAKAQAVINSWCPHCRRDKFGSDACKCPGSGMLAGHDGTMNLGIERLIPDGTNNYQLFMEEFTSIAESQK